MKTAWPLLALCVVLGCQAPAPKEEASQTEPAKPVQRDERFVGYWNQRFELRPDPDRDDAETKMQLRMTDAKMATFRFEKDGTFVGESLGFANKGTWTSEGDTMTLEVVSGPAVDVAGAPYSFTLDLMEDGSLQGTEMEYAWHLTRIEE